MLLVRHLIVHDPSIEVRCGAHLKQACSTGLTPGHLRNRSVWKQSNCTKVDKHGSWPNVVFPVPIIITVACISSPTYLRVGRQQPYSCLSRRRHGHVEMPRDSLKPPIAGSRFSLACYLPVDKTSQAVIVRTMEETANFCSFDKAFSGHGMLNVCICSRTCEEVAKWE